MGRYRTRGHRQLAISEVAQPRADRNGSPRHTPTTEASLTAPTFVPLGRSGGRRRLRPQAYEWLWPHADRVAVAHLQKPAGSFVYLAIRGWLPTVGPMALRT